MKIFASFSMGKSSALMCKILKESYSEHEIVFGCANTSWELPESITFGKKVDEHLGLGCVVLESVTHHDKRKGSTHKIVTWDECDMRQGVFENMIDKYGIPNPSWLHCTRELKTNPMTSYLRSIGWKRGDYKTAIGYRADEIDRMPEDYEKRNLIFPLIDHEITKEDVYKSFADDWPFTLEIEEHEGNCQGCFKKNQRKLLTIMRDNPKRFDFPERMEVKHPRTGPEFKKNPSSVDRRFFRKHQSVEDLRTLSKQDFESFTDELYHEYFGECGESCEPFVTD